MGHVAAHPLVPAWARESMRPLPCKPHRCRNPKLSLGESPEQCSPFCKYEDPFKETIFLGPHLIILGLLVSNNQNHTKLEKFPITSVPL